MDAVVAVTAGLAQTGAQDLLGEAHHLLDHLVRGVVGAAAPAQVVVVDGEERLVEVEVRVPVVSPDGHPVDAFDGAGEEVQGHLEPLVDVVGEELEGLAHQGVTGVETPTDLVEARAGDRDALRACEEQGEGDGLGVAVGEGRVVGGGEEQTAPVAPQTREGALDGGVVGVRPALRAQLLPHGLAQEAAEWGDVLDEDRYSADGRRIPEEDSSYEGVEGGRIRGAEFHSGALQRPGQDDLLADLRAVLEDTPVGAVGVEQVRQVAQALPLPSVVTGEGVGVDALAGPLHLDVAGDLRVDAYGVVGTDAEVRYAGLRMPADLAQGVVLPQSVEQLLQRAPDRSLTVTRPRQTAFALRAELRDGVL